jgi:hypothetical protein
LCRSSEINTIGTTFWEENMRKRFYGVFFTFTFFLSLYVADSWAGNFALVDSFPRKNGDKVSKASLADKNAFLRFNQPIDRSTIGFIRIRDLSDPSVCQLNICGCLESANDDTYLFWVPNSNYFGRSTHFRIELGVIGELQAQPNKPVKDIFGDELEITTIDFEIEACEPLVDLGVQGPSCTFCPPSINCWGSCVTKDVTVTIDVTIQNPICSNVRTLEGKIWVKMPGGLLAPLADQFLSIALSPGETSEFQVIEYTFSGDEPLGQYTIGAALIDPITGQNYSRSETTFSHVEDP